MKRLSAQALWLLVPLLACGGRASDPGFRITLEQGGGFTGLYAGYHLYADGRVESWRELPGGIPERDWSDSLAPAPILELGRRLQTAGSTWRSDASGNMTSRVHFDSGDSTRTWSWAGTGPPPAPAAFAGWYRDARALCRTVADSVAAAP